MDRTELMRSAPTLCEEGPGGKLLATARGIGSIESQQLHDASSYIPLITNVSCLIRTGSLCQFRQADVTC
jgi:hypothetical protein